ncbi:OLC1v1039239C1 [Oldenlandia corymbosa var. corymbosa]|uniref:OLC1v1039239C1 n=1 Tax=Oldenlandia corymbosa var. corymbosa TaxID=529605 RepID=A0AAV1D2R1_OLDCO|nr:OLC1v1039239C1 [Oldenlandia corymbosa var. corymbosa]
MEESSLKSLVLRLVEFKFLDKQVFVMGVRWVKRDLVKPPIMQVQWRSTGYLIIFLLRFVARIIMRESKVSGSLEAKGWPLFVGAYIVSKAAINAYTRIVATKLPNVKINCICPGKGYPSSKVDNAGKVEQNRQNNDAFTAAKTAGWFAVITGSKKGLGFEIVRQLASHGITVVLTTRDEKKGTHFTSSKSHVNLLWMLSFISLMWQIHLVFPCLLNSSRLGLEGLISWQIMQEKSEPEQIVILGKLLLHKLLQGHQLGLNNIGWYEFLSLETVDEVLYKFLKDVKEGLLETEGRPSVLSAYTLSKTAMSAFTRILAKNYTEIMINCVAWALLRPKSISIMGFYLSKKAQRVQCGWLCCPRQDNQDPAKCVTFLGSYIITLDVSNKKLCRKHALMGNEA